MKNVNIDERVVEGFGSEWSRFDQSALSDVDHQNLFDAYFIIFPWHDLPAKATGVDIGCGSGRWAYLVAPKVAHLHLADPSIDALSVAESKLADFKNTSFHNCSVDELPFENSSLDFAYSLGVLHHVPDTVQAIESVARILKRGAPFLCYLYYAFDNRPFWFHILWRASNVLRWFISRMPNTLKNITCDAIAFFVYFPLARIAKVLEVCEVLPQSWPLSYYRNTSFYVMRTDSLDRFGTRLEHRFSLERIKTMLERAGFEKIKFSDKPPFWCAVAYKK